MNTDSKVISDVDRLRKQLVSSHDSTLNKARAKSMAFVIHALCKVQDVSLFKLANSFDPKAKSLSSMRRVQHLPIRSHPQFRQARRFHIQAAPIRRPMRALYEPFFADDGPILAALRSSFVPMYAESRYMSSLFPPHFRTSPSPPCSHGCLPSWNRSII